MGEGKPRLLDLFCGAGGCSKGYQRAGFYVVGVDIAPQPNYCGDEFEQAEAVMFLAEMVDRGYDRAGRWFDAVHASPPCQAYTKAQKLQGNAHPDLIEPVRTLLSVAGLPYVIENVPGAPLIDPVVLEGQMFDELRTIRPRHFETNWPLEVEFMRSPRPRQVKMGRRPANGEWIQVVGNFSDADAGRAAMGIDWMTRDELSEAIPPAYTEHIGRQLADYLAIKAAA
jgi:DNA (cytosine-5)-methyltransferase 1